MYWMTNREHGVMPVENLSEVQRNEKHGWTLLNQGEKPDLPPKGGAPAADEAASPEPAPAKAKPGRKPKAK